MKKTFEVLATIVLYALAFTVGVLIFFAFGCKHPQCVCPPVQKDDDIFQKHPLPKYSYTSFKEDSTITMERLKRNGWNYVARTEHEFHRDIEYMEWYTKDDITLIITWLGEYRSVEMFLTHSNRSLGSVKVKMKPKEATMSVVDRLYNLLKSESDETP